jgi:hypothetical protein
VRAHRLLPFVFTGALLPACAPAPVAWTAGDLRERVPALEADVALARALMTALPGAALGDVPLADSAAGAQIAQEPVCAASVRAVRAGAQGDGVVWWSARADGRAVLRMRSADTAGTWRAARAVDTVLARDSIGCQRPSAAIALDARTGWVHVAYTLVAPEGPGVFYAHQMDPRAPFEPPRVIMYGEGRPAAAVASDGDVVAVAFENPNDRPTIGLAVSRTGGHLFEPPVRASSSSVTAVRPRVAVDGDSVAVGWIEPGAANAPVTIVVRRGRLR